MAHGRFVGVGIDVYDDGSHARLDYAVRDVEDLHILLGADLVGEPLKDSP